MTYTGKSVSFKKVQGKGDESPFLSVNNLNEHRATIQRQEIRNSLGKKEEAGSGGSSAFAKKSSCESLGKYEKIPLNKSHIFRHLKPLRPSDISGKAPIIGSLSSRLHFTMKPLPKISFVP